jgi:hypothetical protein
MSIQDAELLETYMEYWLDEGFPRPLAEEYAYAELELNS